MSKIFLVEDNTEILQAMQHILAKWQYQSFVVQNWQQVTQEIQQLQPDLIVMDITLPMFDGFYWTKQIRTFSQIRLFLSQQRKWILMQFMLLLVELMII